MVIYQQLSVLLKKNFKNILIFALMPLLILLGCSQQNESLAAQINKDIKYIQSQPKEKLSFNHDIKPILEKRCIVCHGCYDAPCQLKLSSFEGIERGANKLKVYPLSKKPRLTYQHPTRLFIDASTSDEWRDMDFFSVTNEEQSQSIEKNLQSSVLYKMLNLKRTNSDLFPESGMLPEELDVSLERKQVCTTLDEFDSFAKDHPRWGMPYALPNLPDEEYNILVQWLGQGVQAPNQAQLSSETMEQVKKWEDFFNDRSKGRNNYKKQLVSRYIYEHLVLGHLYFATDGKAGNKERQFFRLIRSRTDSGKNIEEIPSVRPYDDPGVDVFYYRLRPYTASIVDKNHITYELSDKRMARYNELFLEPDYQVTDVPDYNPGESPNYFIRHFQRFEKFLGIIQPFTPFETFAAIPPKTRYQFLLDDARFFINGFIKGPVCRAQSALSSIEDHYWVFFLKPEDPPGPYTQHGLDSEFLKKADKYLHLPTELGDTNRLFTAWIKYWPEEQKYMQAKLDYYYSKKEGQNLPLLPIDKALDDFVWNGVRSDGTKDQNAALTVFRHFDSASVHYGLLGDEPETAWMLDYPVFERLHYLLVAGYNVFGTVGHQASARLYMDFLRIEAEDNFLFFLPKRARQKLYESWHDIDRKTNPKQRQATKKWLAQDTVTGYSKNPENVLYHHPKLELFSLLKTHAASEQASYLTNLCDQGDCSTADREMQKLTQTLKGKILQIFPEVSYVRLGDNSWNTNDGTAYTLIHNKSYRTDTFAKEINDRSDEDMTDDTLTVLKGLAGSYPNFFFQVTPGNVEAFIAACTKIRNREDYERMVNTYGVRRTNPDFWKISDWFQNMHARAQPVESGILDLSRYKNR